MTSIYLDYQATTPIDPQVREAMLPWLGEAFGNPHTTHEPGCRAAEAVRQARLQVALGLNAQENEIIFASGATEANNLAILGAARFAVEQGVSKRHIVTVATEHRSVLEPCAALEREGFEVTVLPVEPDGRLKPDVLTSGLREDTLLVSVMAVNNETGVIQPLAEIGALCRALGVYFHTDAAQAFGKIPLDVQAMQIDMLSVSGHKVYAPQGIGALYLRRKPRARIAPLFHGGGQERGLRPGTVPVMLAVGLGEAARIAQSGMKQEQARIAGLRERFLSRLAQSGCECYVVGSMEQRVAGNLNLAFPGWDSQALLAELPRLAVSGGAACSSGQSAPSHVLRALGVADGNIRIGFGRFTTAEEVDAAAEMVIAAI